VTSDFPTVIEGDGPPLLCLHGGPGMSDYLGLLGDETDGWRRIRYTQRGLPPSTTDGPFTVAQHVADAVAVLDGLEIADAVVLGSSWGGFLGAIMAMEHPGRVRGLVMVDPLGIVGDGGYHHFEEQMLARTPEDVRERAEELDQRAMSGEGTDEDALESLRLVWPGYFNDPAGAAPIPPDLRLSVQCYSETVEEVFALLESGTLPERAAAYDGPVEIVHGLGSPFAPEAAIETAHAFPQGSATGVPEAGHFPWLEQPGCVADALVRLAARL
jgi:pimeloyl-ACP methyl ester carboxylesterase